MASVQITFPREMHVMVAMSGAQSERLLLNSIRQILANASLDLISATYHDQNVAICPRNVLENQMQFDLMAQNIAKAGLLCGVSNCLNDIGEFYTHYRQACDAVELLHKGYLKPTWTAMYRDMSLLHCPFSAGLCAGIPCITGFPRLRRLS